MNPQEAKLPKQIVWAVLILCTLPAALNLAGVEFTVPRTTAAPTGEIVPSPMGALVNTVLEWSSFCIALCTVIFAFTHYSITRDVTAPIIGTALFFSGMMDAFQTLAADELIGTVKDPENFLPFTWSVSRTFNVCILIAGTTALLGKKGDRSFQTRQPGLKFIIYMGILFGLAAYAIIFICGFLDVLPQTVYPGNIIPRPWDAVPLVLYLFAGGVILPRFHRQHSSLLSHGLMISLIPLVFAQFYVAFGSKQIYDNNFNIASYLKIIAYAVPLAGLILDYTRAYRTEVTLRTTEEKLRVARDVYKRLLPEKPPQIAGYDMAGYSIAADTVGGDYFDYVAMKDGCLGVVVADVSGHDIGAAIVMAHTRAYLRALAQTKDELSPMMSELNALLVQDVQGRWFVTMFFVRLEPGTGSFEYSGNGHESYLFDDEGTVTTLENTSPPLGILERGTIFTRSEMQLKTGNILLLLTDGFAEAKSPDGEYFGLERVFSEVRKHRKESAKRIADLLYQAVTTYRQGAPLEDDVTVVVLKRNGTMA